MTVSAQTPINRSTGNGVTTVFPYTFKIIADADIEVTVDDVVKTLNVDYTVSGAGVDAGGNVTMTVAPANATSVVRRRNMALVRSTDYQDQGELPATTLDNDIDATVLMVQQLDERLDRTFSLPASFSGDSTLPAPDPGYLIGWDATGENLTNIPASVGSSLVDLAAPPGSSLVGYLPAGTGAVATTVQEALRERVSVKDFGAVGDGVTDDAVAIQTGIARIKITKQSLFFPSGVYLISDTLTHTTPNELLQDNPNNGIHLIGEIGSVIKAAPSWTTTKAMLNLDANPAASELVVAYAQQFNRIEGLTFDGSSLADRAIRLRGNWYSRFSNLNMYDFKGAGLGVIDIVGVTTPTKDDADCTCACTFENIKISGSASGYGVLGVSNRSSSLTFIGCDIRDCYGDGIRLSVAGMSMYGCIIAGCGNASQNTTGGLAIVKPQTNARVRGVAIHGCEFENNYWHEVNIDYCFGFTITGCFGSPYQHSGALGQSWIRMGGEAAQGGVLSGNSTMDYSDTYGYNIRIYDFKAGAKDISIVNPVIQRSTAVDYLVDAAATNIKKDDVIISTDKKAAFSAYLTNGSADLAIVTATFTKIPFDSEEYDQGTGSFDAVTNRRFQPFRPGYYQINVGADFTPSGGASRCILVLYKNGVAYKRLGDISAAGGQVTGGALVSLTGSDYVEAYIYITAATPKIGYGATVTYMNGAFVADA